MRELDETKVYDLKDLNDKQLRELVEYLSKEHNAAIFHHKNFSIIKKHVKNINQLATNKYSKSWGLYPKDYWDRKVINALELFQDNKSNGLKLDYIVIDDEIKTNKEMTKVKKEVVHTKSLEEWNYVKNKIGNPMGLSDCNYMVFMEKSFINLENGKYGDVSFYQSEDLLTFNDFKSRYEPQLKIGDTFEYNGFVCEVKEKIDLGKWYRIKTTRKTYFTKITEKRKRCYNNVDIVEITNKEFIKQLEENAR